LNLLITGGADYLARIWNPYVTQKNTAILEGHHSAVIDIKINERLSQCYTFSKDAVKMNLFIIENSNDLLGIKSLGIKRICLSSNNINSISDYFRW
jgi:WD40 repeat protein